MFKFTTETILNDLSKVNGITGATTDPGTGVTWDPGIEPTKKALFIKKLNKFVVAGSEELVKDATVYKRVATAATLASKKITLGVPVSGTLYRVGVQITTNGYSDGMFARDRVTYGKPFYVEVIAADAVAANVAIQFKNAWNKTFESYDNFVVATTNGAELIFTAENNPFITFPSIIAESINTTTGEATLLTWAVAAITAGLPAFGDYTDLIKNHRLPTIDNFRPFGLNQEELPVVGATYDQYTFVYSAERGAMGQSIVGQTGTSETTHVIWVNTAAAQVVRHITGALGVTGTYSFDEMLQAVGLTIINPVTGADLTPAAVVEA